MINGISIQNYRNYKNTKIDGFKRFNLIGGLNNSGKTILLEAILLNLSPTAQNVTMIRKLREDLDMKELPEYAWDNFFLNQDKNNKIIISSTSENKRNNILSIECNEIADNFKEDEKDEKDENLQIVINDFIDNDVFLKSVLHFKYEIEGKEVPILDLMAHKKGTTIKELNIPVNNTSVKFIPASSRRTSSILARDYGVAEKKGKEDKVLEALKIIDENIEAIKISVIGGAHIEIKRIDENFMPVSLFGDAINKILNIVLTLINNNGDILLIDEIENGIHYKIQKDFWKFIFSLSHKNMFDVQIFATTHSLEMINAFIEASKDIDPKDCSYFELFKKKSSGNIEYNLHDLETLSFELSKEMNVRGE